MLRALHRPHDARRPGRQPQHGLAGRLALGAGAAALVAFPFTLLMLLVLSEWEPLDRLDRDVADRLNDVARGDSGLVDTLEFASDALSPWVFRLAVLAVAVWLWRRGAQRLAAWSVVTMAIGGILGVVLKLLVDRARPSFPEPVAHASGYSFPSGHALNSFLGVGVLLLVFLPVLTRVGRAVAFTLGAALVLLTGYDRVALGVHYVSDVLAGWAVALACLVGTGAGFEIWRREHGRRPSTVTEGVEPEAADEMSDR
ncbi:MAG TPA: phosphatase PAP2 family protein [Actinomycetes bacterium]